MAGAAVSGGGEALEAGAACDPLIGRVLGAYRIEARVGEGGEAGYMAAHLHLERTVLFKLFPPAREGAAEALRRAVERARALSALKPEGVMPLVEIGEHGDGFLYLVLELAGARPLSAWLAERGPLSWPSARDAGRQLTAALMAAQAASIPVPELGPAQVYLAAGANGAPRALVDLATPEALGFRTAPRAPEQVRAMGRLLYTMLAGREPATAAEPMPPEPLPPDLTLACPDHDIPAAADALVMRAVDPEPARRWPDLAALHAELGGGRGEVPSPLSRTVGPSGGLADSLESDDGDATFGRRTFARPSRRALVAGGVSLAVAIGLAAVILSSSTASGPPARAPDAPRLVVAPPPPAAPAAAPAATGEPGAAPAVAPATPPVMMAPAPEAPLAPATPAAPPASASASAAPGGMPAAPPAASGAGSPVAAAPSSPALAVPAPAPETRSPAAGRPEAPLAATQRSATAGGTPAGTPQPRHETAAAVAALPGAVPRPAAAAEGEASPVTAPPISGAPAAPGAGAGAAAPVRVADTAPCRVSLGSIPWSDVWVDGRRAGFTPLTDLQIACGTHDVLFTSAERGLQRRIKINVQPGDDIKRIVDLAGPGARPAPAAGPAAARPACKVTLGSRPWSEVWIDGRRAGTTPLVDYPVACGAHDVLFLSRDANVQRHESIDVQSSLKKVVTLVDTTD